MSRLAALVGISLFTGTTLLLSELRWFRRRPLVERLAPYVPGGAGSHRTGSLAAARSFSEVLGPLVSAAAERVARSFGVTEPVAARLERIHAPFDGTAFRMRQLGWTGAGLVGGTAVAAVLGAPGALVPVFVIGGPLLAFLVVEQRLSEESRGWQRRIVLELPVVAEQLGMLLGAGYSLGGAIARLADRGRGACGRDLRRVRARVRQGLTEVEALREWAAVADVPALHRLVGVLALNRQAADLGRLIGEEARSIRRDVHRDLIETIERRAQQVWIPVTVAALVPGVVFLAVPFVDALRMFSNA